LKLARYGVISIGRAEIGGDQHIIRATYTRRINVNYLLMTNQDTGRGYGHSPVPNLVEDLYPDWLRNSI
jgi:hypothetical protein